MQRNDLSPTRRRTRNVIAAPIPPKVVETAVSQVDRVPDWLNPVVFLTHMIVGIWILAHAMTYGLENRFSILVILSAFLFANVAFNAHFPSNIKRWCMAVSDLLAIIVLRLVCELTIVSDPNTTFVLLLGGTCILFSAYLDPILSKTLTLIGAFISIALLLPYIFPGPIGDLLQANFSLSKPLDSILLLVSFGAAVLAPLLFVTTHRRWRLANATRFLERVQTSLATSPTRNQ